jgi:excisionase family DNA binding protein
MNAVPKKLETAETVAPMLGLSKQALYEAVRRELIPAVRIGRRIRFNLDTLAEWSANGGKAIEATK